MCRSLFMLPRLLPLLLCLNALPSAATDGVLELNQTCAVQTGCVTGDSAGFPITLDGVAGSSYRLTSDLRVSSANTDVIVVNADDLDVDLNGFSIVGPVVCSGTPLFCTPNIGSGIGIKRTATTNRGLSVHDGSIVGMGLSGVQLGDQAQVRNLRLRWNRGTGITAGAGTTATAVSAHQNGLIGINVLTAALVTGSSAQQNGTVGINTGSASTVTGSSAYQNGSDGIVVGASSLVSGNTAHQNTGIGISASSGSSITSNNVFLNAGGGILANSDSTVDRNTITAHTQFSLNLGTNADYRDNTIRGTGPLIIGNGRNMGGNSCNASCP